MSMTTWIIYQEKLKNRQKKHLQKIQKETEYQVNRIIKSVDTEKKTILDFKNVHQYLKKEFPDIDLSNIPIYITSSRVMNRVGLGYAGGCYIDFLKVIIVQRNLRKRSTSEDKFHRLIGKETKMKIEIDDILVHECLHAISSQLRSGSGVQFRFGEEEFVYTNCIDYYKEKGMTEEEIAQNVFLPFCLNDVLIDHKFMSKCCDSVSFPKPEDYSEKEYEKAIKKIYNKYANSLVPIIIKESRNRAMRMIDLYNKYGQTCVHTKSFVKSDPGMRACSLDMDWDF